MASNWRHMTSADIPSVIDIASRVHLDYPEDDAVLAERQKLYPAGCLVLDIDGRAIGYTLTHPWTYLQPPPLNALLGAIPANPSTYYIHDVALLPEARGSSAGTAAVRTIIEHAAEVGLPNMSLIAVKGTSGFWTRQGFVPVSDATLDAKLKSYDDPEARFMVRPL